MSEYPPVRCGACDQETGADPRNLASLDAHHQVCPAQPYWGRGFQAGRQEALADVRLHGNPEAPERAILMDLISELRNHPAGEYCCCGWCERDRERADRAEARLRDLN